MPTSKEQIQAMYDQLYKSKYDALEKEKNANLSTLATKDTSINNSYLDTKSQIDTQRNTTAEKYKAMYGQLDTQAEQGKQKYYDNRNETSYTNAKNTQAIRDYMAKQNLLQSGESVDALLRNNTDFSNNMSSINKNETLFNNGINSTRKGYQTEEMGTYANLDNTLNSALRERDRQLAELQAQRNAYETSFNSGVSSTRAEIEAQKMKEIMAWEDEQAALAAQQAAATQAASSRSSSSGGSGSSSDTLNKTEMKSALENAFQQTYSSGDLNALKDVLGDAYTMYLDGTIGEDKYNQYSNWYKQLQGIKERPNNSRTNKVMKY